MWEKYFEVYTRNVHVQSLWSTWQCTCVHGGVHARVWSSPWRSIVDEQMVDEVWTWVWGLGKNHPFIITYLDEHMSSMLTVTYNEWLELRHGRSEWHRSSAGTYIHPIVLWWVEGYVERDFSPFSIFILGYPVHFNLRMSPCSLSNTLRGTIQAWYWCCWQSLSWNERA